MSSSEVLQIFNDINNDPNPDILTQPLDEPTTGRPNSYSVNGAAFGDEGKGAVGNKINELMLEKGHELLGFGVNGGPNAGHEFMINGTEVLTSQCPSAVASEGATAIMSRGKVIHPTDLIIEMNRVKKQLGAAELPGNLIIDSKGVLSLDTHRAYERALSIKGSTGRGIGPGYASVYERTSLLIQDLMDEKNWENTLREHYRFYQQRLSGHKLDLETMLVPTLAGQDKIPVGSEAEFIDRLRDARTLLLPHVSNEVYDLMNDVWNNQLNTAVVFDYSQASGLDPMSGVRPDTTSSRPLTRYVGDSTYYIANYEDIRVPLGVMKTYMSSVGSRILPSTMDVREANELREENNEFGKVSGRPRDVYETSIPLLQFLRRADGYKYTVITHLDSSKEGRKLPVVLRYVDRITGKERPYSPYQEELNKLDAEIIEFDGWDGEAVKNAKSVKDFPIELRRFVAFISRTVAPVAMGTTGPEKGDFISWLPSIGH